MARALTHPLAGFRMGKWAGLSEKMGKSKLRNAAGETSDLTLNVLMNLFGAASTYTRCPHRQ